jgi:hypothetical protein
MGEPETCEGSSGPLARRTGRPRRVCPGLPSAAGKRSAGRRALGFDARHPWRAPFGSPAAVQFRSRRNCQAKQGEPEKDKSPVDCWPGERPSQEGLGRYASEAGTAKRRGGSKESAVHADRRMERSQKNKQADNGGSWPTRGQTVTPYPLRQQQQSCLKSSLYALRGDIRVSG